MPATEDLDVRADQDVVADHHAAQVVDRAAVVDEHAFAERQRPAVVAPERRSQAQGRVDGCPGQVRDRRSDRVLVGVGQPVQPLARGERALDPGDHRRGLVRPGEDAAALEHDLNLVASADRPGPATAG
ncbi:hypothetical protein [Aeromicrobium massiliense]|uniref:hypothetical protein n=1 Tax=Aeromicrobium massiliense TaxID=1464554 RepID=UPI000578AB30|nr:hypothetical protein [Aeromicrobium massiliense]